jgi:hypothetical protein
MKLATPRKTILSSALRVGGQDAPAFDRHGEINANDRADLFKQIARIMDQMSKHNVVTEEEAASKEQVGKENRELLQAAFDDAEAHRQVGEIIANDLYVTGKRQGFMRRFMARGQLAKGADPKIWLRQNNVITARATTISKIETQYIWDPVFYPQEFYIQGRVFVEKRDMDRANGDVLQDKFNEGLAHLMVMEDRIWYDLVTATVNTDNDMSNFVGTFNPNALGVLYDQVTRWGIPAAGLLIASDLWRDFLADTGFQQAMDPVTKYELVSTGVIGTLKGVPVISDSYRFPEHKVLTKGDLVLVGNPEMHGQYTDRDGVTSEPITMAIEGTPGKGWMWTETMSMFLANARSVAKGNRV